MILIFVTFPNKKEAVKIANHLLDKRLAGCITMFPVDSFYWWQGKKVKDKEIEIIIKTRRKNFEKVKEEIKKLHSYTVPQIIAIDVAKVNDKYFDWLKKEVR